MHAAGRMQVRAETSATVLERMVSPGQRVDEADALLRLADARKLMLELNLTVAQAQTGARRRCACGGRFG
jgi:cobalt-zinc-cadmium efflux system membrane fusion protein